MAFAFTKEFIDSLLTYSSYQQDINEALSMPAKDAAAEKLRPYTLNCASVMDRYDASTVINDTLKVALTNAPSTTWLVITEGWCGDAGFNVPVMAAIEKAVPGKVKLRLALRDTNLDLIDAYLTDGGRSIPKLIVLNEDLQELGIWGPRPAPLQSLMKGWKSAGLELKELVPKVQEWYDADQTQAVQAELTALIQSYS